MSLLDDIISGSYKSVSVIGMSKNAGKTVTLNYLIDAAYSTLITLGMTSIGRDGEQLDLVTKTDKPMIYAYAGTIIATAEPLIELATARIEILQITPIGSAMGKIVIARIIEDGYVQLAGPATTGGIKTVMQMLLQYGAEIVLVDGALDRRSLASPSVTEATILATGAVLSRTMDIAVLETTHRAKLFYLKQLEDELNTVLNASIHTQGVFILERQDGQSHCKKLDLKTALGAGKVIAKQVAKQTTHIVLTGSLGEKILDDYLQVRGTFKEVIWVVQDATKIFISPRMWQLYLKRKLIVKVLKATKLLAITYNPTSPEGYYYDPDDFEKNLKQALPTAKIINAMTEDIQWNF